MVKIQTDLIGSDIVEKKDVKSPGQENFCWPMIQFPYQYYPPNYFPPY